MTSNHSAFHPIGSGSLSSSAKGPWREDDHYFHLQSRLSTRVAIPTLPSVYSRHGAFTSAKFGLLSVTIIKKT
jgi:hypothetical protein